MWNSPVRGGEKQAQIVQRTGTVPARFAATCRGRESPVVALAAGGGATAAWFAGRVDAGVVLDVFAGPVASVRGAEFDGAVKPLPSSFLNPSEAPGLSIIASAIAISAASVFAFAGSAWPIRFFASVKARFASHCFPISRKARPIKK